MPATPNAAPSANSPTHFTPTKTSKGHGFSRAINPPGRRPYRSAEGPECSRRRNDQPALLHTATNPTLAVRVGPAQDCQAP
jgi:hypothetical protein